MSVASLVRKAASLLLGCVGLAWAASVLPSSGVVDELRGLQSRLLHSENFSPHVLEIALESANLDPPRECETDAQVGLLLIEMRLAEASLRAGQADRFDQFDRSAEQRTQRTISCAPRQSFAWLMAFGLELLHGRLDAHALRLLELSYTTSPNEAWIAVRRNLIAVPILQFAQPSLREEILGEFQRLVAYGFNKEAARSFLGADQVERVLLQSRIEQLEADRQKDFWAALQSLKS